MLPVKTPEEAIRREIFQMTPFITLEQEKEILPQLPDCESGRWFLPLPISPPKEIPNKRVSTKSSITSVFAWKKQWHFGDGGNDVSMLRHAAIGVAMGNAVDEVKEHANYITTSVDEDGVANALKHFSII